MQYLTSFIISIFAMVVILAVLIFIFKKSMRRDFSNESQQVQKGSGRRKLPILQQANKITWDMIGGYEDVKKEIRDYLELPLKNRELAKRYGLKLPNGILLFGPP
ncbi:MAG: AAA family ATPase, partial [Sulfolobus sp.]|nr:AAA family ATPase [Sulfolobus sp.]